MPATQTAVDEISPDVGAASADVRPYILVAILVIASVLTIFLTPPYEPDPTADVWLTSREAQLLATTQSTSVAGPVLVDLDRVVVGVAAGDRHFLVNVDRQPEVLAVLSAAFGERWLSAPDAQLIEQVQATWDQRRQWANGKNGHLLQVFATATGVALSFAVGLVALRLLFRRRSKTPNDC